MALHIQKQDLALHTNGVRGSRRDQASQIFDDIFRSGWEWTKEQLTRNWW